MIEQVVTPVLELIDEDSVRERATPSNFRLGQAILQIGHVDVLESTPDRISGRVTGGQRRRVLFWSEEAHLQWRCSCTLRQRHIFCKHCVALALTVIKMIENEE